MDLAVLPGPSLAELARTAVARATAATVACADAAAPAPAQAVPLRAGPAGQPILLPALGSELAMRLASGAAGVTVYVPADPPYRALRLTGRIGAGQPGMTATPAAYPVVLQSAQFTGASGRAVSLAGYHPASPDPLWREAPGILRHLSRGHVSELTACVRAHGLHRAEWVTPSALDRFGLRLLVFTADGVADTRLSFPGGPVTSFSQVPLSLRAVLACRCHPPGPDPDDHDPGSGGSTDP
jgi:hypothetical protein